MEIIFNKAEVQIGKDFYTLEKIKIKDTDWEYIHIFCHDKIDVHVPFKHGRMVLPDNHDFGQNLIDLIDQLNLAFFKSGIIGYEAEKVRDAARSVYRSYHNDEDVMIDSDARVEPVDDGPGYWVDARLWIYKSDVDDFIEDCA